MIAPTFIYKAEVTNVVDGDTVDMVIDQGFYNQTKQRVRLLRVNTPELTDKDPAVRQKALEAKQFVINTVLNKKVVIRSEKSDSFGRFLAEVYYLDGEVQKNLSDELINGGLAVHYTK
jgi:micrococcal nuclease